VRATSAISSRSNVFGSPRFPAPPPTAESILPNYELVEDIQVFAK